VKVEIGQGRTSALSRAELGERLLEIAERDDDGAPKTVIATPSMTRRCDTTGARRRAVVAGWQKQCRISSGALASSTIIVPSLRAVSCASLTALVHKRALTHPLLFDILRRVWLGESNAFPSVETTRNWW
jgi:hypothetical protein